MNKFSKTKFSLIAAAQILAITLLSACTSVGTTLETTVNTTPSLTACHATGDSANPYEEITINNTELNEHQGQHPNDISPVPVNGCPAGPVSISAGKITICHATGSDTNPYNKLTVSVNGLEGHGTHEGDIFPASDGTCPTGSGAVNNGDTPLTVCHATDDPANPYEAITVNGTELNEHQGQHPNDIIPAPESGCPASPETTSDGATNDGATNDGGKITICHITGSKTNPYNEITVSVNGLNGHDKHDGDIIPAPEGGCPASSGDNKHGNDKSKNDKN